MIRARPVSCDSDDRISFWRIWLGGTASAADQARLSAAERDRAARFHDPSDRRRYEVAHSVVRQVLASLVDLPAEALRFRSGAFGKPHVDGRPGLHFSISYAGDHLLLGVSPIAAIGVDIEAVRPIHDADDLADLTFCAAERATLRAIPTGQARQRAFLIGWTRKEACLKALGVGLSIEPGCFQSGIEPTRITAKVPIEGDPLSVQVGSMMVDGDLIGAWSIRA